MNEKELETWKQGFREALGWRDHYSYRILGHDINFVLKAIREYENKNVNFTNVMESLYSHFNMLSRNECTMILTHLETIGIIKFEEAKLKIIDIVDEAKVEIRRNGKVIYSEGAKHEAIRANEGLSSTSRTKE